MLPSCSWGTVWFGAAAARPLLKNLGPPVLRRNRTVKGLSRLLGVEGIDHV